MTGIVCTVSPRTVPYLARMKKEGMSMIRINGSFGIPDISKIKKVGLPILLDIPGDRKKKKTNGMTDDELIRFAIRQKLDYIGISYVKSSIDIEKIRAKISGSRIKIVAKVETKEIFRPYVLSKVITNSDIILIDRGDLGTAIGFEKVPIVQHEVIYLCSLHQKKIIVATEMMMSTINSKKPNCADVSDVFNAVSDGADYVMLSEETAKSKDPLNAVKIMKKVIECAEENSLHLWGL